MPCLASLRQLLLSKAKAHPGLAPLTTTRKSPPQPTPCLVAGVERVASISTRADPAAGLPFSLYGHGLSQASDAHIQAAVKLLPLHDTGRVNLIAMEACKHGMGEYDQSTIEAVLTTAYTAFRAAVVMAEQRGVEEEQEPRPVVIHTGNWGCGQSHPIQPTTRRLRLVCAAVAVLAVIDSPRVYCCRLCVCVLCSGAFGGNVTVMALLQMVSARLAGVSRLIHHTVTHDNTLKYREAQRLYGLYFNPKHTNKRTRRNSQQQRALTRPSAAEDTSHQHRRGRRHRIRFPLSLGLTCPPFLPPPCVSLACVVRCRERGGLRVVAGGARAGVGHGQRDVTPTASHGKQGKAFCRSEPQARVSVCVCWFGLCTRKTQIDIALRVFIQPMHPTSSPVWFVAIGQTSEIRSAVRLPKHAWESTSSPRPSTPILHSSYA